MGKPTIQEVIDYARPIAGKLISEKAADAPREHKDEIEQCVMLRLIEAYPGLDESKGWKSFVYNHTRGAILDYLKFGDGFAEQRWSLRDGEPEEGEDPAPVKVPKLTSRVELYRDGEKDDAFDIDRALGQHSIFHELDVESPVIKWELLARLASKDEHLHAFAKYLRGISIEDMAPVFGVVRTRVSQMIQAFLDRFDDGEHAECQWFMQTCYALGVSRLLGMPDEPVRYPSGNHVGFNLNPVDLDSVKPHHYLLEQASQMEMKFDEQEETPQDGE